MTPDTQESGKGQAHFKSMPFFVSDALISDYRISRILKSEVMAGLDPEVIPSREKTGRMFSGKYGQIEFVKAP